MPLQSTKLPRILLIQNCEWFAINKPGLSGISIIESSILIYLTRTSFLDKSLQYKMQSLLNFIYYQVVILDINPSITNTFLSTKSPLFLYGKT